MKNSITIQPAPPELTRYIHANLGDAAAVALAASVEEIESHGVTVTHATAARSAVPLSYRSAHRMHAPCWRYNGETRTVYASDGSLPNRPRGHSVPPVFVVADSDARIPGYRCFKRDHDANESTHRPQ